jgi:hypothetical protein
MSGKLKSDHQMIITTINARPKIIRNKSRKVYLYKKGNLDAVKDYLDSKLNSFKEKYKEMNIEGCKQCSSTKSIASWFISFNSYGLI